MADEPLPRVRPCHEHPSCEIVDRPDRYRLHIYVRPRCEHGWGDFRCVLSVGHDESPQARMERGRR